MQGIEAAYLSTSHHTSKLIREGWIPYKSSTWSYKRLSSTVEKWVSIIVIGAASSQDPLLILPLLLGSAFSSSRGLNCMQLYFDQ